MERRVLLAISLSFLVLFLFQRFVMPPPAQNAGAGATGATGPEGPQGQQGLQGPAGDLSSAWPVGSVFLSVVATNPATLLGIGIWVAFAVGRMLVGLDPNQAEFDTSEKTGGAKTHTLTIAELPSHTHLQDAHTHVQNAHQHTAIVASNTAATSGTNPTRGTGTQGLVATTNATAVNQNATAVNQSTGGGGAHNNLPPYIVVYAWKRTA